MSDSAQRRLNPETGLLQYSYAVPEKKIPNLTLLNAFLWVFGPMHERTLCIVLTVFHVFCCAVGFAIRYSETVTNIFYDNATLLSKC
jgi:UDP-N-acetylglucosamine--dolichyl-phosphate N-acetylglucosaminephosphotransferase